nr:polymorphic toxin type 44 domain-containing protein [Kitasatospora sp. SID7827]
MTYEQVLNAPLDALQEAALRWKEAADCLGQQQDAYRDSVLVHTRESGWQGKDADAAQEFMAKVSGELREGTLEARSIQGILTDCHGGITEARKELLRLSEAEAPRLGLVVGPGGKVTAPALDQAEKDDHDRSWGWGGDPVPSESEMKLRQQIDHDRQELERAVINTRARAHEADRAAAWALRQDTGPSDLEFRPGGYADMRAAKSGQGEDEYRQSSDYISKNDYYFKVPERNVSVSYDIYSNIHYGYVGKAAGLSEFELMNGANGGLSSTGTNDEGDDMSMKLGMQLYDKYGPNMTKEQMDAAVLQLVDEMEAKRQADAKYLAEHPDEHRDNVITQVRPWPN